MIIPITPEWQIATDRQNVMAQRKRVVTKSENPDKIGSEPWHTEGWWPVVTNGGKDSGLAMAASFIADTLIGGLDNHTHNEVGLILDAINRIHATIKDSLMFATQ